jgi:alpha-amylase
MITISSFIQSSFSEKFSMKFIYQTITLILAFLFMTACSGSPAITETTSPLPSSIPPTQPPTATIIPSPTASATPEPTNTALPSPTAWPTVPSTPVQPVTGLPKGTDGLPWWNDSVFYEIFVRSFYDSDGNGIGDFNGLTSKLDYLNDGDPNTNTDLGITAIWLMPINASPSYHGYDVTDYYDVNSDYGSMDDFKNLVKEAHKRGIRVTIDWVLNHTSSRNSWFDEARDPQSPYRNWYVWSATRPSNPGWNAGAGGEYYYGLFSPAMPDLNYRNPAVVAEMKKFMRFWLKDVGVDGFRLDAAKHIIEDGSQIENTAETHAFYKDLRKYYKSVNPQAMTVGEVWNDSNTVQTYLNGDELDLAFDFDLGKNLLFSAGTQTPKYAIDAFRKDLAIFRSGQFATFLTNHDQDRSMTVLNDNVDAAKNAAMLLLTAPGVPFIYYGEEIGLLGKKPDEDIRRPLQWSAELNAGFSTGTPWRAPASDYTTKNIAFQLADPNSLLSFYRSLIQIRDNHVALRVGDAYPIESGNKSVFASLRASKNEAVLILINMSSSPISDYSLKLETGPLTGEYSITPLLGGGVFTLPQINAANGFDQYIPLPEIPANGRLILQLQKLK